MEKVSSEAFARSLAALKLALQEHQEQREGRLYVITRNSLILEFEICFGQCKGALQRWFVEFDGLAPNTVDEMSFPVVIRTANEFGYTTATVEQWVGFRNARNRVAHAYSEPMAEGIALEIPYFVEVVSAMLEAMQRKELGE